MRSSNDESEGPPPDINAAESRASPGSVDAGASWQPGSAAMPRPALPIPADLVEECYEELHVMARRLMRRESPGHTLQPTALVAELWIKLANGTQPPVKSRAEFLARAAVAMRHLLISHARRRLAEKRGGDRRRVPLGEHARLDPGWRTPQWWLEFDEELKSIESVSPRAVRIFEMRFIGGMPCTEIADLLGIPPSEVRKERDFVAGLLHARMVDLGLLEPDDADRDRDVSARRGAKGVGRAAHGGDAADDGMTMEIGGAGGTAHADGRTDEGSADTETDRTAP